jgi:hypothetical protein
VLVNVEPGAGETIEGGKLPVAVAWLFEVVEVIAAVWLFNAVEVLGAI